MVPYPTWLNAGDNAWQLTAGTLVGLMSIPALAVLYGGLVQKKWAMNTVMMVFTTFCLVLIVWVLWGYKLGFGTPLVSTFLGDPRTVLGHSALQGQANIPLLNGLMPNFRIPAASVIYFQFVFAAITPILFIGHFFWTRPPYSTARAGIDISPTSVAAVICQELSPALSQMG